MKIFKEAIMKTQSKNNLSSWSKNKNVIQEDNPNYSNRECCNDNHTTYLGNIKKILKKKDVECYCPASQQLKAIEEVGADTNPIKNLNK